MSLLYEDKMCEEILSLIKSKLDTIDFSRNIKTQAFNHVKNTIEKFQDENNISTMPDNIKVEIMILYNDFVEKNQYGYIN